MNRLKSAFTIIELLTVIAITSVLLTIITLPIFQSFQLTRNAEAYADAQEKARQLSDRISREIGNAVGIRDGSAYVTAMINGTATQVPAHSVAIVLPSVSADGSIVANANPVQVLLPYSKLDIIQAAQVNPQDTSPGIYHDPRTGFADPTLKTPRGQVAFPVSPGQSIIRYWVGLHEPLSTDGMHTVRYREPYTGLLMASAGATDNLYVLYRAEIQPYVYRSAKSGATGFNTGNLWRPNLDYFQSDATDTMIEDFDDPNFFSFIPTVDVANEADGSLTALGTTKAARVQAWQKAATVQTSIARYDAIFPVYDKHTRKVVNRNGIPVVLPLIQFRPTRVSAETAAGQSAVRLGEESVSGPAVSPDVYTTQYGLWSNPVARVWPVGWQNTTGIPATYEVARRDINDGVAIYAYRPGIDTGDDTQVGLQLFNLDVYDNVVSSGGLYPFTQAALSANTASGWLGNGNDYLRAVFTPFTLNRGTGKLVTSFNISEVGNPSKTPTNSDPANNVPSVMTNPSGQINLYTPSNDPNLTGNFYDAAFSSINERFNKIWTDFSGLRPNLHRFIDLRVTPQADGTLSPLYPDFVAGAVTGLGKTLDASGFSRYSKVSIVPGTEEVIGPDQLNVPTQTSQPTKPSQPIRYTRVQHDPGPNQYTINYTDLPEPTDGSGNLSYATAFPGFSNPKTTYDATDFVTAILQPRFKVGYIQLNSDPNSPIPAGSITVNYRFQVSGARTGSLQQSSQANADTFAIDYDSRQLMNVLLTVRNYPQSGLPNPPTVTLKSTAMVRNYVR